LAGAKAHCLWSNPVHPNRGKEQYKTQVEKGKKNLMNAAMVGFPDERGGAAKKRIGTSKECLSRW